MLSEGSIDTDIYVIIQANRTANRAPRTSPIKTVHPLPTPSVLSNGRHVHFLEFR